MPTKHFSKYLPSTGVTRISPATGHNSTIPYRIQIFDLSYIFLLDNRIIDPWENPEPPYLNTYGKEDQKIALKSQPNGGGSISAA